MSKYVIRLLSLLFSVGLLIILNACAMVGTRFYKAQSRCGSGVV